MKIDEVPKEKLTAIDLMKIAKDHNILVKLNEILDILDMQNEINIIVQKAYDKLEKRVKKLEAKK